MLKRIGMALLATVLTLPVSFAQQKLTPDQQERIDAMTELSNALNQYNKALERIARTNKPTASATAAVTSPYAGCVIPGNAQECWFFWSFYRYCAFLCINSIGGPNVSKTNGWFYKSQSDEAGAIERSTSTAKYKADKCTPETGGGGTFNTYFYTCSVYGGSGGGTNPYQ